MRKMNIRSAVLAAAICLSGLLSSCGGEEEPQKKLSIAGAWELMSVQTKAAMVGGQSVNVFIEFTADSFVLYQQLGSERYYSYNGTYTLTDGKLKGNYSDGSSLGSIYDVECDGSTLVLTTSNGKEVDSYKSITAIPESVISNAVSQ